MPRQRGLISGAVVACALSLLAACGSGGSDGSGAGSGSPRAISTSAASSTEPPSNAPATSGTASVASATTAPPTAKTALFFGDSNFVGGGCTPDPKHDMAQIAADQLGYQAVIRGEGGTGFATGNSAYGLGDFLDQIAQGGLDVSPAPALVVIEGGSNDTRSPLDPTTQNAETVLRDAQSKYPDALVVLMGPIDVRAGYGDISPRVVGALEYAAGQVGVPFLNAYDWLPWRTTDGLMCSDFDHATLAGHEIVGQRLAAALSQLGA